MSDDNPNPPGPAEEGTEERDRRAAPALIALLLLALALYAFSRSVWWVQVLSIFALGAFVLFLIITYVLPDKPKAGEWLVDHGVTYLTSIVMIILAAMLLAWWLVNFHWAADDQLTSAAGTSLSAANLHASATYPAVALIRPEDDTLTLTFAPPPTTTIIITVLITPRQGLTFVAARGQATSTETIKLGPNMPQSERVAIINAETFAGLRAAGGIDVTFLDARGTKIGELAVPVTIEGQRGFALRRFVTSTIDQASPLIFLLLLVLPGLATLVQKVIEQRFSALQEQRQEEYKLLKARFREELRAASLIEAVTTLDGKADRPGLQDRRYRAWNTEAIDIGRQLLSFARLEFPLPKEWPKDGKNSWPDRRILQMSHRWPEEFAWAYIQARRILRQGQLPDYYHRRENSADSRPKASGAGSRTNAEEASRRPARTTLPAEQERRTGGDKTQTGDQAKRDAVIKRALQDFVQEARYDLQYQEFTDNRRLDIELAVWASDHSDSNPPQRRPTLSEPMDTGYSIAVNRLAFPFALDDARDLVEAQFLRAGAFYGPESRVGKLRFFDRCLLVHGAAGSGRTTMASMFPFQPAIADSFQLPIKFYRRPDSAEFSVAMARQLLRFIAAYPTKLGEYGPGQREFLAWLIGSHLGKGAIPVIEQGIINIRSIKTQGAASMTDRSPLENDLNDPRQQEFASRHLESFKRLLQKALSNGDTRPLPHHRRAPALGQNYGDFLEAAEILEFQRITFVFDANTGDAEWLLSFVQRHWDARQAVRTFCCVFVPDDDPLLDVVGGSDTTFIEPYRLKWTGPELTRMAAWRYERYLVAAGLQLDARLRGERVLLSCFGYDKDVLTSMLDGSKLGDEYNPRRFMKLWQLAAGNKRVGDTITQADVGNAIGRLKEIG